MPSFLRRFCHLFVKKVTPKEKLTSEMLVELRSLRLAEPKLLEQIKQLKIEKELANNRHKIYAEHLKAHYLRIFKEKLLELRGEKIAPKKAA